MTHPGLIATLLTAGCMSVAGPSGAIPESPRNMPIRSEPLPPPASRGAPEAEEAAAALAAGSSAALILFLARHPDAPAAPKVRAALSARRAPDAPAATAVAGGESAVVSAFDAARLAGTADAWSDFIARYPTHPLAAEAARWRHPEPTETGSGAYPPGGT